MLSASLNKIFYSFLPCNVYACDIEYIVLSCINTHTYARVCVCVCVQHVFECE